MERRVLGAPLLVATPITAAGVASAACDVDSGCALEIAPASNERERGRGVSAEAAAAGAGAGAVSSEADSRLALRLPTEPFALFIDTEGGAAAASADAFELAFEALRTGVLVIRPAAGARWRLLSWTT